jgi:hypothetical protein
MVLSRRDGIVRLTQLECPGCHGAKNVAMRWPGSGGGEEADGDCCIEREDVCIEGRRRSVCSSECARRCRVCPVLPPRLAFVGFRFPWEVIVLTVRWYLRYGLGGRRWSMRVNNSVPETHNRTNTSALRMPPTHLRRRPWIGREICHAIVGCRSGTAQSECSANFTRSSGHRCLDWSRRPAPSEA